MATSKEAEELLEKQGGIRLGEVVIYPQPKPQARYVPHRNRPTNNESQPFSLHDRDGKSIYRSVHAKMPTLPVQPRHHHDFEQIRFIIDGVWNNDHKHYGAGMLGYFPEGVFYGPQVWSTPGRWIVMQFTGPSGTPMMDEKAFIDTANKLKEEEGVVFQDGTCVWPDGRKQDGAEVVMEKMTGKPMVYPPARYGGPVWYATNNIPWAPTDVEGVSVKRLGFFNERGPSIEMIQLSPGATLPGGQSDRRVTRYIYKGEAKYESVALPSDEESGVSNISFPPDTEYSSLSSETGATILSVETEIPVGKGPYLV